MSDRPQPRFSYYEVSTHSRTKKKLSLLYHELEEERVERFREAESRKYSLRKIVPRGKVGDSHSFNSRTSRYASTVLSLLTTQADKSETPTSSQLKFSVLLSTPLSIPPVSSFAIESSPSPSLTRTPSSRSTRNLTGRSEEKETNNSLTGTTKDTFNLGSLLLQLRRKSPRFRKDLKRTKMRRWIKI